MTSPNWQCPGCAQWVTTTESEHECATPRQADHATAWNAADEGCDTCWYFITSEALFEIGADALAAKLRKHLESGHMLTSEEC